MIRYLTRFGGWVIVAVGVVVFFLHAAPCAQPIRYSIGEVDTRFGVTPTEYTALIGQAEAIWEKALGKDLFEYDPKGSLSMNLVYDTRQVITDTNKVLETDLKQKKAEADAVKAEYTALESTYNAKSRSYESAAASYKARQAKYSDDVDYWNARGGAPKAEYQRLAAEKQNLQAIGDSLEGKRLEVNALASRINAEIKSYNSLIEAANSNIHTINQTAGEEFNEGEYVSDEEGRRITIYEFSSKPELVRVLAHELGHSLGLEHNANPDSIMFYLNESQNAAPTPEDIRSLKEICRLE